MDPATEARETADRLAALAVGLRRLDDSSFAELAVVLREAFELGCYYLYRAASAWDAGAVDEARLAVAALAGCDLLVRRQVHRLGQTLGSTLMPDYLDEMSIAVFVQDQIRDIASSFDVDVGDAQGPETIRSRDTLEEKTDLLSPLLNDDHSDAPVLAVTAACIAALRDDVSPRRWLEELAAELPRKYWDAREFGFLFQNPDAVTSMMRSASRLRRAHALHGDREPLPSGNRHPFARLFEFPEDDE